MTKLSEMSLSELWRKFPIILAEHSSEWNDWYADEESYLRSLLSGNDSVHKFSSEP